jgi:hypothetical protein
MDAHPEKKAAFNKGNQTTIEPGPVAKETYDASGKKIVVRGGGEAPKMHTGGIVPKTGKYTLQAGEEVIPVKHAGHGFKETNIEHHPDGSMTVEHVHEDGEGKHVKHAVMDLDGLHDSLEQHLRTPEAIEKEIKDRGVDPERLEEVVEPGLHDKALDYLADKEHVSPDDIEERVSPGVHERMARLMEKD